MNMPMMLRGVAPSVRRIAMSACLSVTSIISIEIRLITATRMISDRITNITIFSIDSAENRLALVSIQVCTRYTWPSLSASSRATGRALNRLSRRSRMPVGPLRLLSFSASPMLTSARPESYCSMPSAKMPTTWKLRMRGTLPIGVARSCCTTMVTRSPTLTPSVIASSCPSTMFQLSGVSASRLPSTMCLLKSSTFGSSAGSMPRTIAPLEWRALR